MKPLRLYSVVPPALALLAALVGSALFSASARAEYRAYELEVYDLYDCRINKRETCRSARLLTAMNPDLYQRTHGGPFHIGVLMLATWMCYGDTSFYDPVCPRPVAKQPKFAAGDNVKIALARHITGGWVGRVEVAYYQHSVRSNVYGIRFPDRRNVYARYFEKDLAKPDAKTAPTGSAAPSAQTAPGTQPAPETQPAPAVQPAPAGLAAPAQ